MDQKTREALEYKLDIARGEAENYDDGSWADAVHDIEAALKEDSLKGHKKAAGELENYLDTCYSDAGRKTAEWKAIFSDLARAGFEEVFNPNAVYLGGRPRTMMVDGVRYEC